MTAEYFIQSFKSHKMGDKGFCQLASITNRNEKRDFGFWFEILRRNGQTVYFSANSDHSTRRPYRKTFFVTGISQFETVIDALRLKAQDDLSVFLRLSDSYKGYVHMDLNQQNRYA